MSSLRNAVKRVTHKERSQPQSRARLGILEKKKDYVLRARDYHKKEDRVKTLRQKAAMKNPDEFYFGMHNSEVKDGKHRKTVQAERKAFEESIGLDTVRIMKDQDLSYVRMQKQKDVKKMERLKASLHDLEAGAVKCGRKHTIFVENSEEAKTFDVAKHFDTVPELAGRAFNRPRVGALKKMALQAAGYDSGSDGEENKELTKDTLVQQTRSARRMARKIAKARAAAYGEMEAREKRVAAMERAEAHLVTEKLVAGKGRKRKIKEADSGRPAQYKWRRKRLG